MKGDADKLQEAVLIAIALLAMLVVLPSPVRSEEGGSGPYAPGAAASFIDAFPGKPGAFVAIGYYTHYQGSAEVSQQLPLAGLVTFGLEATSNSATLVGFYETKLQLLGGHLAAGAAIPFVWLEAQGSVSSGLGSIAVRDSTSGIGDLTLYPLMLGWVRSGGELKYDVRLGVYAPTGGYDKGRLANIGKNYWTFEPGFFVSYLGSKNGREASAYAAFDFNTKNTDTDYQTGTQFHIDATLAQHLPLLGGVVGLGGSGFYYQQIGGDSGAGAVLGDFKGRTVGVGPVLSYVRKVGNSDLVSELKWLPELDVSKRLEGDFIWLKAGLSF